MDSKKLINFSNVSQELTGNKNTIRANRNGGEFSESIKELVDFLDGWVLRNSKSEKASITIKTKESCQTTK